MVILSDYFFPLHFLLFSSFLFPPLSPLSFSTFPLFSSPFLFLLVDDVAGFAIMAANFISKDEMSQNIVNTFIQRKLQHAITALKRVETATARHRAVKKLTRAQSPIGDEYSVHGYIKGACIMFLSLLHLFEGNSRYVMSFLLLRIRVLITRDRCRKKSCERVFQSFGVIISYTVVECTALYSTLPYSIVQYCTVLYCTVLYCTVLYCTVLYCTVLYCTHKLYIESECALRTVDAMT